MEVDDNKKQQPFHQQPHTRPTRSSYDHEEESNVDRALGASDLFAFKPRPRQQGNIQWCLSLYSVCVNISGRPPGDGPKQGTYLRYENERPPASKPPRKRGDNDDRNEQRKVLLRDDCSAIYDYVITIIIIMKAKIF